MPIYEYLCEACGHELEAIQKLSDAVLRVCPVCEKKALKKKLTASVFRLSGSGWYETDFKTGDKRNLSGEKATEAGAKNAAEASGGAGETKSAAEKSGDKAGDKSAGSSKGNKSDKGVKKGSTATGN